MLMGIINFSETCRTVIFSPFQDRWAAELAVPDACEGQNLDLVLHELAQVPQQHRLC